MEGDLKAIPLTEVLELVHAHRRSGVLEVRTGPLPLTLRFALGEVVGASILDWEGPDALFAFPSTRRRESSASCPRGPRRRPRP